MTNRKTLFISDLHLSPEQPAITNLFLNFLQQQAYKADALYILGDFFEVWIGDDDQSSFHQKIKNALKVATQQGLPIYFLHGNRDFLIGKQFFQETGCQLLQEETRVVLYDTPVLLMHGDTLCTLDVTYLKWRKHLRNTYMQKLFSILPLTFRLKIANKIRAASQQYTQLTPTEKMDVTSDAVVKVMQKHQVNFLIHGHTHQPNIHSFSLNEQPSMRMVLGAWHKKGSVLVWSQEGQKNLIEFE